MFATKVSTALLTEMVGRLEFDDEALRWVRDTLHASHAVERPEHEEAIKRHQYGARMPERPELARVMAHC
ncbi:MAG: hypothetical protein GEU91_07955 [Rhizobiales bacterium]|nr:hypothetical protein [Hyphomicrobiales bacterium]